MLLITLKFPEKIIIFEIDFGRIINYCNSKSKQAKTFTEISSAV